MELPQPLGDRPDDRARALLERASTGVRRRGGHRVTLYASQRTMPSRSAAAETSNPSAAASSRRRIAVAVSRSSSSAALTLSFTLLYGPPTAAYQAARRLTARSIISSSQLQSSR